MSFATVAIVVCLGTVLAGLGATHSAELREHRWLRIILSLPLALLIASVFYELEGVRGYFAMWAVGLLAFIWKTPIAHFCAFSFTQLIHGNLNQSTGIRAEIAGPKALFKHGDFPEALALTLRELDKEPEHYEGLLLLADIHEAMEAPREASAALEKLLRKRGLTADQRNKVSARRARLEERLLVADLNRR